MRSPDFIRFQAGQLLSSMGGRCSFLALSWWTLESTGSKAQFSHLALVFSVVGMLSLPLLAPLADRWSRKGCAAVADLCTLAGVAALYLVTNGGVYHPMQAMMVVGVLALASSFMVAVASGIVPMLVPRDDIGRAQVAVNTLQAVVLLTAPLVAGYAAQVIGLQITLLATCALLSITLACTWGIRADTRPCDVGGRYSLAEWCSSMAEGIRLSTRIRAELAWNLISAAINGCMVPFSTLIVPVILLQDLQLGMVTAGWFAAASAVGLLSGGQLALWLLERVGASFTAVVGVAMIGAGVLVYAVSTDKWLLICGSLVSGFGIGLHNFCCTLYRSVATPTAYRGRLKAWGKWSGQCAVPLGLFIFGLLLQHVPSTLSVGLVVIVIFSAGAALACLPSIAELLGGTLEERHDFYLSRYPSAFGAL